MVFSANTRRRRLAPGPRARLTAAAVAAGCALAAGCPDDDDSLGREGDRAEEEDEAEAEDPEGESARPADGPPPLPERGEVPGGTPEHEGGLAWVQSFGSEATDAARDVAPLGDGAVVVGYVAGDVAIGDARHETEEADAYVARLGADGEVLWARFFHGEGEDIANGVAVTEDGNIAVAGAFAHDLYIGEEALAGAGADHIFVTLLSPEGDRLWARSFGGRDVDAAHAVSAAPGGRIYVTGVFRDEVDFGADTLVSPGDASIFALALDAGGAPEWARGFGGEGPDYGRALVPHPEGAVLLGEYSREVDFGDHRLEAVANRDVVLALLDPRGEPVWAEGYGGVYNNVGVDVAVDPAGDIVATGSFDDEVDFGAGPVTATGQSDVFLLKVSEDGEPIWQEHFGSAREDMGTGVAAGPEGEIATTGWFWNAIEIGDTELESADRRDGYAALLSSDGEPAWAQTLGGDYGDMARAVAIAESGRVFVAGTFHRTATIGDRELVAATERAGAEIPRGDAFVAAFDP